MHQNYLARLGSRLMMAPPPPPQDCFYFVLLGAPAISKAIASGDAFLFGSERFWFFEFSREISGRIFVLVAVAALSTLPSVYSFIMLPGMLTMLLLFDFPF
jgi:hypothetical protein